MKTVLGQERDREKTERDARRLRKEESMKDDPQAGTALVEEVPTCEWSPQACGLSSLTAHCSDTTIEAPPSVLPHLHLCDITGLEVSSLPTFPRDVADSECHQAPYTDPATGLRYHDKNVYEIIKGLVGSFFHIFSEANKYLSHQSASTAKDYLSGKTLQSL